MCVFCKIINKELSAKVIAENELALAILDIYPVNPGHNLVIPKKHYANLEEIEIEDLKKVIELVKIVGFNIKNKLNIEGYNVILNNDKVAGQEIAHLHFHIVPRFKNDNLKNWPQKKYKENEMENIFNKLKE